MTDFTQGILGIFFLPFIFLGIKWCVNDIKETVRRFRDED